jgi:hypothetical protein
MLNLQQTDRVYRVKNPPRTETTLRHRSEVKAGETLTKSISTSYPEDLL